MNHIKLTSFLLKENIQISDVMKLENECKAFVEKLIQLGVITSVHKDLTSSDVSAVNYTEDIAEVVRNEIIRWKDTINSRGGR